VKGFAKDRKMVANRKKRVEMDFERDFRWERIKMGVDIDIFEVLLSLQNLVGCFGHH
jgi:hypothetical protein